MEKTNEGWLRLRRTVTKEQLVDLYIKDLEGCYAIKPKIVCRLSYKELAHWYSHEYKYQQMILTTLSSDTVYDCLLEGYMLDELDDMDAANYAVLYEESICFEEEAQ